MNTQILPHPKKKRRVKEPSTQELQQKLLFATTVEKFIANHTIKRNLSDYLNQLLEEKSLKRSDVVRAADLNSTYGWDIFKGKRKPSREPVLALVFGMRCTLTEANRALQAAGHNQLYCKNRRDAIIIFCIHKGFSLQQANELLYKYNEETINDKSH